jgi:DNA polymerase-3 subunit delta
MPEVNLEQLLARVAKGKPVPAITLLGSDFYLRDLCREKLIAAYLPEGTREWALTKLSAAESGWDAVFERAQMLPMLAPVQIILIEDAEAWEEMEGKSLAPLEAYLDDPAPFTILVFEAADLDQRRKFYKTLAGKSLVAELRVSAESAAPLVADMAKRLGTEIEPAAAAFLTDILDGELARVRTELDKLAAYAAGRRITSSDVEALVVAAKKYTVWQFSDVLATRQRAKALEFLDSVLREGEEPVAIVGALAWMFRKLLEASELGPGVSGWQAARALGMPPDRAEKAIVNAKRIPREQLQDALVALAEADNRLKSGTKDTRAVMEFLAARLTAGAPSAA